jgi:hypothetical protein
VWNTTIVLLLCLYILDVAEVLMTMNSASSNALNSGGKAINSPSSHTPLQHQQQHTTSPGFESSSRRPSNQLGSVHATSRNNQANKKLHKNTRKPRLFQDEDAMAESVRQANFPTNDFTDGNRAQSETRMAVEVRRP